MGETQPRSITLQLVDKSIVCPRGVVKDVLVKEEKFIFPTDFVVLDMEEDEDIPIILGRPFMNTCDTVIEVRQGKLTLRMGEEQVVFKLFDTIKKPTSFSACNFI